MYLLNFMFFCVFVNVVKGNGVQTKFWRSHVYGSGVGNRDSLRYNNVKTETIKEQDVRWLLCSKPSTLIGVQKNEIFVHGSNETVQRAEGEITAATVIADSLLVATRTDHLSSITSYKITENLLIHNWDEDVELPVDYLAGYQNFLIIIGAEKMEIYRKTDFWMIGTTHLPETVHDVKIIPHENFLLVAIALDSKISIYKVKNRPAEMEFMTELLVQNPKSLELFQLGMNIFLATGSTLFKLQSDSFQLTSNYENVDKFLAIPLNTYRHDVLLLAQNDETVFLFEPKSYSGFQLNRNLSVLCQNCQNLEINLEKAVATTDSVLLPLKSGENLLIQLEPILEQVSDQFQIIFQELEDLQKKITELFEMQNKDAGKLLAQPVSTINFNGPNTIGASWEIKNLEIDEGKFIETDDGEFQVDNLIFAGNDDWTEEDTQINLQSLLNHANSLLSNASYLSNDLQIQSFDASNNILDEFPSYIDSGLIINGQIWVDELITQKLNGQNTNKWMSDCFLQDKNEKIYGTKTVTNLQATSIVVDTLGGIPSSELIFKDTKEPIIINGDLNVVNAVVTDDVILSSTGTVNEINLLHDLFLVNIEFRGYAELESVAVNDAHIVEILTGNNSYIIPEHFSLNDFKPENYQQLWIDNIVILNDFNVTEINNVAIKNIFPMEINNNLEIETLSIENLNGKKFPQDFISVLENSPNFWTGVKNFENLNVGALDTGIQVFFNLLALEMRERSAMPSVYIFNDVEILQPLETKSVNNKNLSQFFEKRCSRQISNDIDDTEFNYKNLEIDFLEIYGDVKIETGEVSGYLIDRYKNYLSKTKDQKIPAEMVKKIENLETDQKISKKFLNVTGSLSIENLTFYDEIHVKDLMVDGLVSSMDFEEIYKDAVLKNENLVIGGRKIFKNLIANYVNAFAVNDWRLDELATRQGAHTVHGPVILNGRVHVKGDLNALSHFNKINLTHLSDRVSTSFAAFLVPGNLTLASNARVKNLLVDGLIQGTNFTQFIQNETISRQNPVQLDGEIQFDRVDIKGNLDCPGTLNQRNITKLFNDIVFLNQSADIQELILAAGGVISNLVIEDELTVPLVDGCDVYRWREDAVSLDQDSYVSGAVHIENLSAEGDATVHLLNNRSLATLISLKSSQQIAAKLYFDEIEATGNVQVDHYVNGFTLNEIWAKSLRNNGNQTIKGKTTFASLSINGSVETQKINNVEISKLVTTYTDQTISNEINFTGDVYLQNLTTSSFTGIDLKAWNESAVLTTINHTLNASWTVNGNTTARDISGSGLVINQSLKNISANFKVKDKLARYYNTEIRNNYGKMCESVSSSAATTKNQLRILDMFDDIQGIEFTHDIHSAIPYNSSGENYLLITFGKRCAAVLYIWNGSLYEKISRFKIGTVESWTVLYQNTSAFLVMSGTPCDKTLPPMGSIWEAKNSDLIQVTQFDAFTDILPSNSSTFHTIAKNGSINCYNFVNNTINGQLVVQLEGKMKFVPIDLGNGLSVWNGDEIVGVENPATVNRMPADFVAASLSSGLVALSDGLGVVELYKNLPNGELIDSLHFLLPTHLCWVDLKSPGELYLLFAADHHKIHVFQYKGVARLVKRSTLSYPSSKLSVIDLPNNHPTPTPHLLVIYNKTLRILQVRMFGKPELDVQLDC